MRLFALSESRALGEKIGAALDIPLALHEERDFEDGEHKTRPLESVRGCEVFVIQSLYSEPGKSVNDKLCRLLFFIGALKDASARSVTAVLPYLGYARKDRKTKSRDPVTTRYVAQLLEAVGTNRVLTLDVHNLAAFQNAFRCPTDHLEAKELFVEHFAVRLADADVVVVSPDIGGVKRAELFREALSQRLGKPAVSAFMEKQRSAGVVSGEALVGDVKGKAAIIIDDMISTGGTILRTAHACRRQGAQSIHAAASHGIFVGKADQVVADPALDSLVVTNTLPPFRLDPELVRSRLTVLDVAPLFADAIRHIHISGSTVEFL
ncbi:ribose-phosphate diphosphokinase [Methylobacter sp. YRD-M1]|uniref:ribose-phosphate diphosphokinase n=1 Tax=Methylobacter sp. YRD-M1 TaxID=2911520 RepID=UPI00227A14AD|nr:ribose-phosphate pyrophosphokinase [Methylobacter sp. YRD-M1]WAK04211.1 ribose-phosphate pyrophosphokinase [Methylobacter sp. YRD-M1]